MDYKELMGYNKTKSNKVLDNIKEEFGYVNEGPAYEYERFSKSIEKAENKQAKKTKTADGRTTHWAPNKQK